MPSSKVLQAAEKILQAQKAAMASREEDTLTLRLIKALEMMSRMEGYKGEKGDKGDRGFDGKDGKTPEKGVDYFTDDEIRALIKIVTPVKGKDYFDGKDGENGMDGIDGNANMEEVNEAIDECMDEHMKECNHALIHDPKVLGKYQIADDIQHGELLLVEGNKIVGTKITMPDLNGLRSWVSSQGVSNFRSYPITSNTTIESMAIYVVDASAGNITITVPSAAGRENFWFELIRIDSSANTVTVVPTGSELLNDMTSYIMQQWSDLRIFAYQGNYLIRQAT